MQISGIIVSTTTSKTLKTKAGGTYEGWEIVYKDSGTDEIKTLSKPSQTLTQVPGLKDAFTSLTVGDKFVGAMEKDGAFWKLTSLTKGELAVPLPKQSTSGGWGNKTQARDFETKEERAVKQKLITRQSSISSAIEYLSTAKTKTEEDIFQLAEKINQWVWSDKS